MLLELAIGDAYGAGFEFAPMEKVEKYNDLTQYHSHALGINPGSYTDDTQMSIALALLLLDQGEWNIENIANKFVECFKRDKRLGYSKGLYELLSSVSSGSEFLERRTTNSTRNGACMRAAPLGVLSSITDVLRYAEIQASVTHNTDIGIQSAQAVALSSYFFLKNMGDKSELLDFVNEYTGEVWLNTWSQSVKCCGRETTNALLTILSHSDCLHTVLVDSVNFSGDVDTVASLALGIASQSSQYKKNLPEFLFGDLEAGAFGKKYLLGLGAELLQLNNLQ